MNILSCPRFTVLHPADLKPGDSGAIETLKKHCMDPKARYTPLATRLFRANLMGYGNVALTLFHFLATFNITFGVKVVLLFRTNNWKQA